MTKFLPFTPNNTPIEAIYEKLVNSSKGVPYNLVLGILKTIENKGLYSVRESLEKRTESTITLRYEKYLRASMYSVNKETADRIKLLEKIIGDVSKFTAGKYSNLTIPFIASVEKNKLDSTIIAIKSIENVDTTKLDCTKLFSRNGPDYVFTSKEHLEMYVFYVINLRKKSTTQDPVCAIYGGPDEP